MVAQNWPSDAVFASGRSCHRFCGDAQDGTGQLMSADYTPRRLMPHPLLVHGDESWLGVVFALMER